MLFTPPALTKITSLDDVEGVLLDLFATLTETFANIEEIKFKELHVEPEKPRSGSLYFADGTDWDPGSGRGLYFYDGSVPEWVQL